jgi:hypothetical protein
MIYNSTMLKKLILVASFFLLAGTLSPALVRAEDTTQTCTQITQYGGAVSYVCGVTTHTPVNTGLGDNLALVGFLTLGASAFLLFLSKKAKKVVSEQSL